MPLRVRHKFHPTITAYVEDEGKYYYFGLAESPDVEKFIGGMQGMLSKTLWEPIDNALKG